MEKDSGKPLIGSPGHGMRGGSSLDFGRLRPQNLLSISERGREIEI